MKLLKSIGAVFVGMVTIVILSTATDAILQSIGFFPPVSLGPMPRESLAIAFLYRSLYGVAGGFITAKLAPDQPLRHAIILGLIGTGLSIIGVFVGWDLSEHWYPIALVITALPTTWLGGKLQLI